MFSPSKWLALPSLALKAHSPSLDLTAPDGCIYVCQVSWSDVRTYFVRMFSSYNGPELVFQLLMPRAVKP